MDALLPLTNRWHYFLYMLAMPKELGVLGLKRKEHYTKLGCAYQRMSIFGNMDVSIPCLSCYKPSGPQHNYAQNNIAEAMPG